MGVDDPGGGVSGAPSHPGGCGLGPRVQVSMTLKKGLGLQEERASVMGLGREEGRRWLDGRSVGSDGAPGERTLAR